VLEGGALLHTGSSNVPGLQLQCVAVCCNVLQRAADSRESWYVSGALLRCVIVCGRVVRLVV